MTAVPCNGCTACCRDDKIVLHTERGDDPAQYRWHWEGGQQVLDRKPNRECTYLTEHGCSIHGRAPWACQLLDCRVLFLATPKEARRRRIEINPSLKAVYDAAKNAGGPVGGPVALPLELRGK